MRPFAHLALALLLLSPRASAQQTSAPETDAVEGVDRVVVRWSSRATGGAKKPQFIMAHELAFEARIEALGETSEQLRPYGDKHIRSAIQRHITESMLANLPVDPKPTPKQVATYAEAGRKIMVRRIGDGHEQDGLRKLDDARRAEGMTNAELDRLLRRRARASWYLDKMVAPMLTPSKLDLREVHRRGSSPFTDMRFEQAEPQLQQWYVSTRLAAALDRYFHNARSRVRVFVIEPPTAPPAR